MIGVPLLPFYFIRHGETDWNRLNKIMGQQDIRLNERGISQAHDAKNFLKNIEFGKIWSSPLQRARQTAEIINETFNYSIDYNRYLKERGWGAGEGKSHEHFFPDMKPTFKVKESEEGKIPEGAETYSAFEARVILAFQEILIPNHKPPLVVGHGGTFGVLSNLLAGTTLVAENCALYFFRPPEHSTHSWFVVNLNGGG